MDSCEFMYLFKHSSFRAPWTLIFKRKREISVWKECRHCGYKTWHSSDVHSGVRGSPNLTWAAILVAFTHRKNTGWTNSLRLEMRYEELRCQWFDKHRLFVCLPVSCRGLQNLPVTMTDGMGLRKRYFRPSDNSLVSEVIRIPRLGLLLIDSNCTKKKRPS